MTKHIYGVLLGVFISWTSNAQAKENENNMNEMTIHMGLAHMDGIIIKSETGYNFNIEYGNNFNIEYGRQLLKPLYLTFGYGYASHNNFPEEFNSGNVLPTGVPREIDNMIRYTRGWNLLENDWNSNNFLYLSSNLRVFIFEIFKLRFGIQSGLFFQHKSSSSFRLTQLTIDRSNYITEYTPTFVIDNEKYIGWMVGAQVERVLVNKWYADGEFRILLGLPKDQPTQTSNDYTVMRLGLKRKF